MILTHLLMFKFLAGASAAAVVVPSVPGIEYRDSGERLHYRDTGERLHWRDEEP